MSYFHEDEPANTKKGTKTMNQDLVARIKVRIEDMKTYFDQALFAAKRDFSKKNSKEEFENMVRDIKKQRDAAIGYFQNYVERLQQNDEVAANAERDLIDFNHAPGNILNMLEMGKEKYYKFKGKGIKAGEKHDARIAKENRGE